MSKPKPIHDPHAGQIQVVASWRWTGDHMDPDQVRQLYQTIIGRTHWVDGLDVTVRIIGAGGEVATDEGRYDAPRGLRLGDAEVVADTRPTTTVQAAEGRL